MLSLSPINVGQLVGMVAVTIIILIEVVFERDHCSWIPLLTALVGYITPAPKLIGKHNDDDVVILNERVVDMKSEMDNEQSSTVTLKSLPSEEKNVVRRPDRKSSVRSASIDGIPILVLLTYAIMSVLQTAPPPATTTESMEIHQQHNISDEHNAWTEQIHAKSQLIRRAADNCSTSRTENEVLRVGDEIELYLCSDRAVNAYGGEHVLALQNTREKRIVLIDWLQWMELRKEIPTIMKLMLMQQNSTTPGDVSIGRVKLTVYEARSLYRYHIAIDGAFIYDHHALVT